MIFLQVGSSCKLLQLADSNKSPPDIYSKSQFCRQILAYTFSACSFTHSQTRLRVSVIYEHHIGFFSVTLCTLFFEFLSYIFVCLAFDCAETDEFSRFEIALASLLEVNDGAM